MTLVKGANRLIVPEGETQTSSILIGLGWLETETEINGSAFVVGRDGRVLSDNHFVFFNNASSPEQDVWILERESTQVADRCQVVINLAELRSDAEKVIVTIASIAVGASLSSLSGLTASVTSLQTGEELVSVVCDETFATESLVKVVEIYRHTSGWKVRSVLQGYDNGLGGIAQDLGVEIE